MFSKAGFVPRSNGLYYQSNTNYFIDIMNELS